MNGHAQQDTHASLSLATLLSLIEMLADEARIAHLMHDYERAYELMERAIAVTRRAQAMTRAEAE